MAAVERRLYRGVRVCEWVRGCVGDVAVNGRGAVNGRPPWCARAGGVRGDRRV